MPKFNKTKNDNNGKNEIMQLYKNDVVFMIKKVFTYGDKNGNTAWGLEINYDGQTHVCFPKSDWILCFLKEIIATSDFVVKSKFVDEEGTYGHYEIELEDTTKEELPFS